MASRLGGLDDKFRPLVLDLPLSRLGTKSNQGKFEKFTQKPL
jgi:hypothetical protein